MNFKDIKDSLKSFYNNQAKKFSETRRKKWPEFDYILEEIVSLKGNKKDSKLKILELGCGDGRLFGFLKDNLSFDFEYVGVDLSDNLIEIAKTRYSDYSNANWIVGDMIEELKRVDQQSFDVVILVASFQHIFGKINRLKLLSLIYRILDYKGKVILINWSFSYWFLKKYWKTLLISILRYLFLFSKREWNDLFIPWKSDDGIVFKRYYHIFTLKELQFYLKESNFIIEKAGYIDKKGNFTNDWKNSRNTFLVGRKDVLLSI